MSTIKNLYEKCIKDFNVTRDYNFKYCNCETNKCYQHRVLLRDAYHTRRYIDIWADVVISYFVNNAEYEKYDVIINELIERSSVDLEIYLRELYERLFITKSDYGHQRWLNVIDISKQNGTITFPSFDLRIEIEASTTFPANTAVYALIISYNVFTYTPFDGTVRIF
ncbi:uncharacterized protein LOC126905251 [Daktulosphaira vitifoliae]|uniref:uncharacterized protein LOC126905251 n=1 Tax=Daktulosphaira vitifoliae TaxID=58002 RepID=UPI0021AADB26|nr:uncharacterized protein LOC126905251 [Daktulosphaira vitifoliae]